VKKKGAKFEPYQYITLSKKQMSKRKNKFNQLIRSAKKGSKAGMGKRNKKRKVS